MKMLDPRKVLNFQIKNKLKKAEIYQTVGVEALVF